MTSSLFPTETEAAQLLVGPESITWRSASDARLYLAMLYPLMLQVAHPTVGAGVRDFSAFEQRPCDRLLRSIDHLSLIVYGGPYAVATARRLRAMHKGFTGVREDGRRYYALEPEAYAWVHATLLESYVAGHAQYGRPMSRPEMEAFYREYRGLGRLLGVRERDLPETWDGFRDYFDSVVANDLVRNESVDRVLRSVKHAANPLPPVPDPLWRVLRAPASYPLWVGGLGLMAPELRERLGIEWSRADELSYRGLGTFSRALTPVMPKRLRIMGPDQLRLRREAIARGPLGRDAETSPATPANSSSLAA